MVIRRLRPELLAAAQFENRRQGDSPRAPAIDLLSGLPQFAILFVFPAARGANTWSDRKNRIGAGHFVGIEGIW